MEQKNVASALCLNSGWRVHTDEQNVGEQRQWFNGFPDAGVDVKVPGGTSAFGRKSVLWYENRFTPAFAVAPGQRVYAEFEGTVYYTKVWLNGEFVGDHAGELEAFRLDVTDMIRAGEENMIAVRMYSPMEGETFDGLTPEQLRLLGDYAFQRMLRPVYILLKPDVMVDEVFAEPDCESGKVRVEVTLFNASADAADVVVGASVSPQERRALLDGAEIRVCAPAGRSVYTMELTVEDFKWWDLNDPYLYTVEVTVCAQGGARADAAAVTVGFKTFCADEDGYFRFNGRRLFVKCAHTTLSHPDAEWAPDELESIYKELRYLKACGYNMIRFLCGPALPQQLDYCDRIGLMVYEETHLSWFGDDHDRTVELFERAVDVIVRRDRNHPSLAVIGMLNETLCTGKTAVRFKAAVNSLKNVRALAPKLYVQLSSGRWDDRLNIASGSNPGSMEWDAFMGDEDPAADAGEAPLTNTPDGLFIRMGDLHFYPHMPYNAAVRDVYRSMGGRHAAFLSEAGAGSQANIVSDYLLYGQNGTPLNLFKHIYLKRQYDDLLAMFDAYKMDRVYGSPEEMIEATQQLSARQRALLMDMLRSNPRINGYSMTMSIDAGYRGEGVTEAWCNYKKGMTDALSDGWDDLRWCINFEKAHIYADEPLRFTVDLSDIGVLKDRDYPVRIRIRGKRGTVWEKRLNVRPVFDAKGNSSYVIPVLDECLDLHLAGGRYTLSAVMLEGAHPTCGERGFWVSDKADLPRVDGTVYCYELPDAARALLGGRGARLAPLDPDALPAGAVVLLGADPGEQVWEKLAAAASCGAHVVSLNASAIGADDSGRLPFGMEGRREEMDNWLYHFDGLVYENELTEGLEAGGILDPEYYESVMGKDYIAGIAPPDDPAVAVFFIGNDGRAGIDLRNGLQLGTYNYGEGSLTINTLEVLNAVGTPVADRLLVNMALCAK